MWVSNTATTAMLLPIGIGILNTVSHIYQEKEKKIISLARIAPQIADWFRKERKIEVRPKDIHCMGCRGSKVKHWSLGCWILKNCVDKKN